MVDQRREDRPQDGLRCGRGLAGGRGEHLGQREEAAAGVPRVLGSVRVQDERVAGQQRGAGDEGEFGGQRKRAERRERVRAGERFGPWAAQQMRPWVPAVQGPHLPVGEDLEQQDGDELLGGPDVVAGARRQALGTRPLPQMPVHRPLQSAQDSGQVGLVVHGLAEAGENGVDGGDGSEPMATDVADDHPYAVLGGDHLIQIAADPGAPVGGQLDGGDGQPVDAGRRPQHALRGAGDRAVAPHLPQQAPPDVQGQSGTESAEDRGRQSAGERPAQQRAVVGSP